MQHTIKTGRSLNTAPDPVRLAVARVRSNTGRQGRPVCALTSSFLKEITRLRPGQWAMLTVPLKRKANSVRANIAARARNGQFDHNVRVGVLSTADESHVAAWVE